MPKPEHISGLMGRVREASKKNPERNWRSFPARKGQRSRETLEAKRTPPFGVSLHVSDGIATFFVDNRTGSCKRVVVLGTEPEVTIDIDGNTHHSASLPVGAESTTVEIVRNGRGGEVLATVEVETKEHKDGPEPPHS